MKKDNNIKKVSEIENSFKERMKNSRSGREWIPENLTKEQLIHKLNKIEELYELEKMKNERLLNLDPKEKFGKIPKYSIGEKILIGKVEPHKEYGGIYMDEYQARFLDGNVLEIEKIERSSDEVIYYSVNSRWRIPEEVILGKNEGKNIKNN